MAAGRYRLVVAGWLKQHTYIAGKPPESTGHCYIDGHWEASTVTLLVRNQFLLPWFAMACADFAALPLPGGKVLITLAFW